MGMEINHLSASYRVSSQESESGSRNLYAKSELNSLKYHNVFDDTTGFYMEIRGFSGRDAEFMFPFPG